MGELLGYLIGIIIVIYVIALAIAAILAVGAAILAALAAVGLISGAIVAIKNFVRTIQAARSGVPRLAPARTTPATRKPLFLPQPAYLSYPFDRGWRVVGFVRAHIFIDAQTEARVWLTRASGTRASISSGSNIAVRFWQGCIVVGLWVAGGAQYVGAMGVAALFLGIQTLVLGLWAALVMLGIGVLQAGNAIYSRWYRIFRRCPTCYEQMPIPIFICANCGNKHSRLWPSTYGVFGHICTCGARLPTVEGKKRDALYRVCPNCAHPQPVAIGKASPLHIAFVGGASTGKTNLMVSGVNRVVTELRATADYDISFPEKDQEEIFARGVASLEHGRELSKTSAETPKALTVLIKKARQRVGKLTYFYDAAGEIYGGESRKAAQQFYYDYIDALIFVIDPFAIPAVRAEMRDPLRQIATALRPSNADIEDAYTRMTETLERFSGHKPGSKFVQPLAIVISKVDALGLRERFSHDAARRQLQHLPPATTLEEARQSVILTFLASNGLGNLTRQIADQFKDARYFAASALGRLPSATETREFTPIEADVPLRWVMRRVNILDGAPVAVAAPKPQPQLVQARV